MRNKILSSFEEAVRDIHDRACLMVFVWAGAAGPQNLLRAVHENGAQGLTVISFNFNFPRLGDYYFSLDEMCTPLILADRMKKVITPFPGQAYHRRVSPLEKRIAAGEVELELTSHGTLVERIRAGGSGLGGFYTPVGVGTIVEKGKEKRVIDGQEYLFERPLRADFGLIRAHKADRLGNLTYRGSVRGANPIIAMACDVTIAEVDEVVEVGELDAEAIVTPGIFVHRVVKIPEGGLGSKTHMDSMFRRAVEALRKRESEK